MTVLLSVQGLTKGFGPRPLFTDLSLDLRAGERVGLIGPNGSGKTTLLRLLAGHEEPDAGTRVLRRSARLGYVAQDAAFAAYDRARDRTLEEEPDAVYWVNLGEIRSWAASNAMNLGDPRTALTHYW